jgi:hypothetical protein
MANNLIAKKFQSNAIAITSSKSAAEKFNEKVVSQTQIVAWNCQVENVIGISDFI